MKKAKDNWAELCGLAEADDDRPSAETPVVETKANVKVAGRRDPLSDRFYEPVNHWVIVWVGDLDGDELSEYLKESGRATYQEPISAFARDLGDWYDHDFIWAEGVRKPTSVRTLCELNGVEPAEFLEAIVERSGTGEHRCLLVLWNARRVDGSDRTFAGGRLRCVGCWEQKAPLADPD